jgi:CYTH domain-containing protein
MTMISIRRRRFLLADLPAPLERKDRHLQFFDNFLTETRLTLRQIRTPESRAWQRLFVQEYPTAPPDFSKLLHTEIELDEREYENLSIFEGNELRYNRYETEIENFRWQIDLILNRELWNLVLASVEFDSDEAMQNFAPPAFVVREITNDEFFLPARLVDATLDGVRKHLQQTSS